MAIQMKDIEQHFLNCGAVYVCGCIFENWNLALFLKVSIWSVVGVTGACKDKNSTIIAYNSLT